MTNHAVILDEKSFNPGDLNLDNLIALLDSWQRYDKTSSEQRFERLENATIAIANKVVLIKRCLRNSLS